MQSQQNTSKATTVSKDDENSNISSKSFVLPDNCLALQINPTISTIEHSNMYTTPKSGPTDAAKTKKKICWMTGNGLIRVKCAKWQFLPSFVECVRSGNFHHICTFHDMQILLPIIEVSI